MAEHKTKEVLQTELFSLKNSYHPETMTSLEEREFQDELDKITEQILLLPKNQRDSLDEEVHKMLNP